MIQALLTVAASLFITGMGAAVLGQHFIEPDVAKLGAALIFAAFVLAGVAGAAHIQNY